MDSRTTWRNSEDEGSHTATVKKSEFGPEMCVVGRLLDYQDLYSLGCFDISPCRRLYTIVFGGINGDIQVNGTGRQFYQNGKRVPDQLVADNMGLTLKQLKPLSRFIEAHIVDIDCLLSRAAEDFRDRLHLILQDRERKVNIALEELGPLLQENLQRQDIRAAGLDQPTPNSMSRVELSDGIYFLKDDDEVVYVGKGCPAIRRVAEHVCYTAKNKGWVFNSAYIKPMPFSSHDDILDEEARLIKKLQPRYNIAGVTSVKGSRTLQPKVARVKTCLDND